jgi:hypothetical protein
LGAGLRTVLSVTTMFADKPHRLNGRMCAAISCFDDLASGYGTRVGLPAQRAIAQRFRALARNGPPVMSAVRSLSEEERTWHGLSISVENDPQTTFWGAEQPAVILSRFKPAVAGM